VRGCAFNTGVEISGHHTCTSKLKLSDSSVMSIGRSNRKVAQNIGERIEPVGVSKHVKNRLKAWSIFRIRSIKICVQRGQESACPRGEVMIEGPVSQCATKRTISRGICGEPGTDP